MKYQKIVKINVIIANKYKQVWLDDVLIVIMTNALIVLTILILNNKTVNKIHNNNNKQ